MLDDTKRYEFRAAMWWLVGYSSARSGEEVKWVDPLYQQDFQRGKKFGAPCQE